jgi:polysaccharide deacetylase 2 family uncharacterized protein YibQ
MAGSNNKNNTPWPIILLWVVIAIVCIQGFILFTKKTPAPPPEKPITKPIKKPVVKPPVAKSGQGKITIVLDDWGFNRSHCKFLKDVDAPVTPAVLPELQYSRDVIACSIEAGQDPILHLPLEPHNNKDKYPRGYILTTWMSQKEVLKLLKKILGEYPGVIGVNNHMGSKATENKPMMTTIITELKKRGLFFLDSVTSVHSICPEVAQETGIPFARRDVFLDNDNNRASIEHSFEEGIKIAHEKGFALMIGHDRALTLQIVTEQIRKYKALGYEFISLKDYIKAKK